MDHRKNNYNYYKKDVVIDDGNTFCEIDMDCVRKKEHESDKKRTNEERYRNNIKVD